MTALVERRCDLAAGIIGAVAYYVAAPKFPVSGEAAPSLFAAVVSVAAIAVGFLATAKSILLTIDTKPIVSKLKVVGYYGLLLDYMFGAAVWSFLLAGWSIFCYLPDLKADADWHRWLFAGWAGLMCGSSAACFRVIHVFGKVLRSKL